LHRVWYPNVFVFDRTSILLIHKRFDEKIQTNPGEGLFGLTRMGSSEYYILIKYRLRCPEANLKLYDPLGT